MEILLNIVGIALFANWLTHWNTAITPYRDKVVGKMVNTIVKYNMLWAQPMILIFTCARCLTFFSTLVYTQNLTYALIGSLLAQVVYWLIKKTNYVV